MNIEYTGRHTAVNPKQQAQAEAGLTRIERMLEGSSSAHLILTVDKHRHMAEFTILTAGLSLVAACESNEMESAIHGALTKLEHQVVRHNQRNTTLTRHPREDVKTVVATQPAPV